jgi:hypothetical protein
VQLSITPRPVTAKPYPQQKSYGDPDPALTWQLVAGNLVNSDTLTGTLTHAGVNVGKYEITQQDMLSNPNYDVTYRPDSMTITRAALTVTPDSGQAKVYGDIDPVLTFPVSGWKYSDEDDSAAIITGSLNRDLGDTVATYEITNTGTPQLTAGGNYEVKLVNGKTFSITPAAQSITFNPRPLINIREGSYALEATASSGQTPIFRITAGDSLVELAGDMLLLKQAGAITVVAYLQPNPNYYDAQEIAKEITLEKMSDNNNVMTINVTNASRTPDTSSANASANGYHYWIVDSLDVPTVQVDVFTENPYAKVIYDGREAASFTVNVDRGGVHRIPFAVKAEDGTTRSDTIMVERYLNFSYYTRVKWDNTMFISLGLLKEMEYDVLSCSWYEDGRLLTTGASFSMGDNMENVLRPEVEYYFVLETGEGVIRSTSRIFKSTVPGGFHVYPTFIPRLSGAALNVYANSQVSGEERERNGVIIYDVNGAIVRQESLFNGRAELTTISNLPPGIYIVKVKNWQTKIVVQ